MKPTIEQVDAAIEVHNYDPYMAAETTEHTECISFALRFLRLAMDDPDDDTKDTGMESDDHQTGRERCAHIFKAMRDILLKKAAL